MELLLFKSKHLDQCLELFESNLTPYFTPEEREDYISFLTSVDSNMPYFIVLDAGQVMAAGGYALNQDDTVRFTWGMVRRDAHGKGYGKFLTRQRLKKINSSFPDKPIGLDTSQHTAGFYQGCGFAPVSWELDAYGPDLHKVEMVYRPDYQPECFNTRIKLASKRLELLPMAEDDFELLYDVANDPDIWLQHPASNRYQREVFIEFFETGLKSNMAYLIRDKDTGQIIGSSRYNSPNVPSSVEIGWTFLAVNYWGGAFNAELKDLMLKYAFTTFDKVMFCIGPQNYRSIKAVKKLGAIQAKDIYDPSRPDSVWYELDQNNYVGVCNYGQKT